MDNVWTMAYLGHMADIDTTTTEPSPPEWTLADRLRKAREHAGLDQGELADRIGIARSTVSNYERGSHSPRKPILRLWADETGVPLSWLTPDDVTTPRIHGPSGSVPLPFPNPESAPSVAERYFSAA